MTKKVWESKLLHLLTIKIALVSMTLKQTQLYTLLSPIRIP